MAGLLLASPLRARWAGRLAGALVLGIAAWVPDAWATAGGAALMLLGVAAPAAVLERAPERGRWAVAAVAGLSGAVLLAFTGSVRLAEECALVVLPMLGLAGRPMPPAAVSTASLLVGNALVVGVLRSELGGWVVVPLLVLLPVFLGRRGRGWAVAGAVVVAALGSAPVLIDWFREPPF